MNRKDRELKRLRETAWIDSLQVGDILVDKRGTERVVRKISRWKPRWGSRYAHKYGHVSHIYFAILRCSWTRRPYTLYQRNDIVQLGFKPLDAHIPTQSKIDKMIKADIDASADTPRNIYCWDVVGIVR